MNLDQIDYDYADEGNGHFGKICFVNILENFHISLKVDKFFEIM